MRATTKYVCQQCNYQSPSFLGRCPNCGSWNSLVETLEESQVSVSKSQNSKRKRGNVLSPVKLTDVKAEHMARVSTGLGELDRVLGGGILPGAAILLSGDPGIGKSTVLLHVALQLLSHGKNILYVSGEESEGQIRLRVERLLEVKKQEILNNFLLLSETNVGDILATLENLKPSLFIIDSIQTMEVEYLTGAAGSVGQVRESALAFVRFAKKTHTPVFLVGHVTKEGTIAGPQVLSHMVDTVLFFEGERYQSMRILRAMKNRFGPIDEVGILEMTDRGFKELSDPSSLLLSSTNRLSGKAVAVTLEGTRPLLCEIQALVVPTKLPYPKRVVSGLDARRVELMIAVIQKLLRLPLERFDIFVSTTNGLRVFEPGLDLGICLAIISSFRNKPIKKGVIAISEVSLLGELRQVAQVARRIREAKRLGFSHVAEASSYQTVNDVVQKALL